MLRSITALILIIAVLSANFSRCFIFIGFAVNQNFISAKLCENRSKPKLNCKGKCYLTKKLKQAEEKEQSKDQQSLKNNFQEALVASRINLAVLPATEIKIAFPESHFYLPEQSSDLFKPPQV